MRTLIYPPKTRKSLINQGFRIKNKHRFYDTASYHNYGAYLVEVTGLELCAADDRERSYCQKKRKAFLFMLCFYEPYHSYQQNRATLW